MPPKRAADADTAGTAAAGAAMAADAGGGRHLSVSWDEIKAVQNLIERCLQQYMTQTEIIAALRGGRLLSLELWSVSMRAEDVRAGRRDAIGDFVDAAFFIEFVGA